MIVQIIENYDFVKDGKKITGVKHSYVIDGVEYPVNNVDSLHNLVEADLVIEKVKTFFDKSTGVAKYKYNF